MIYIAIHHTFDYLHQSAAYCVEEVVLLSPVSAVYHTKLAEMYYSCGGGGASAHTNLLKARKHYAMSLNIQSAKNNTRALYGLLATCSAIKKSSKG
jgi:hypothetical protein